MLSSNNTWSQCVLSPVNSVPCYSTVSFLQRRKERLVRWQVCFNNRGVTVSPLVSLSNPIHFFSTNSFLLNIRSVPRPTVIFRKILDDGHIISDMRHGGAWEWGGCWCECYYTVRSNSTLVHYRFIVMKDRICFRKGKNWWGTRGISLWWCLFASE